MRTGKNLESGEWTEYVYNVLGMRLKHSRNRQGVTPSTGGEVTVVPDFLSGSNNELMAYAEGLGEVRNVYGKGYNRLSRHTAPYPAPERKARTPVRLLPARLTSSRISWGAR